MLAERQELVIERGLVGEDRKEVEFLLSLTALWIPYIRSMLSAYHMDPRKDPEA
jgi:hypothetical protein